MNLRLFLLLLLPLIHCEDAKWEPLRVHLHYDATVDSLLGARAAGVKQTLRQVADFYQGALTIRRNTGPLRLAPYCAKDRDAHGFKCRDSCAAQPKCADYPIPRDHLLPCVSCTSGPPLYWDNKCTINGAEFTQEAYNKSTTTPGVANTDLIVYVSATDAADMAPNWRECGYEKLTRTQACRRDLKWDRPNAAAMLIWKKRLLDPNTPPIKDIFMHEFLHILGLFSFEDHRSLENYDYFWKNETHPYRKRLADNVLKESLSKEEYRTPLTKEVTRADWKAHSGAVENKVTVLMTPRVKREVRHHFECDSLEGVELENHIRDVGHFESRLHRQDIFSSRWIAGEKVTRLTFAYLEDSGWYKADKTKASRMPSWQKGLGCDYAKKSCLEWMTTKTGQSLSVTPFCNHMSDKSRTCGLGRTDVGICNLESNQYSFARFRYFADDEHAGGDRDSDSCPYVTNHNRALISCANPASVPAAEANYKNGYLQEFGPTSHCIDFVSWQKGTAAHTFGLTGLATDMPRGGCYKTDCSNNKLKITVAGTTHICTKAGETFTAEKAASGGAIKGTLVCPAYSEVCPATDDDSYLNDPLDELELGWTEEEGGITMNDLLWGLGLWTIVYIGAGGGGGLCLCCCICCIICCICKKKKAAE